MADTNLGARQESKISLPYATRLAFISTYIPRKCGIATYTKDLVNGINTLNPERLAEIIAMDDAVSAKLDYPWEVTRRIRQNEWEDYERVLEYLNNSIIDLVSIQHEYGIFGGPDGDYIVKFVKQLKKPFVVTLHTILRNPSDHQREILTHLGELAEVMIVMLPAAANQLHTIYGVAREKIVAIPHGAPDMPFEKSSERAKSELGLSGRRVMSSINLISRGKGYEYVLEALPDVVKKYPDLLYLIIGQTHPIVLEREGEEYRQTLESLVAKYHLEGNVRFINRYVSLEELVDYIRASDICVTPYENLEQISSGALAYAIAAGKVCVSTPYAFAKQSFAGGRGYFIEPKRPESVSKALLRILNYPDEAFTVRKKCYLEGRKMTWPRVGYSYLETFEDVLRHHCRHTEIEAPTLKYVRRLTTSIGIVEHSHFNQKDYREGYATDDNARALIVALEHGDDELATCYLAALERAEVDGMMYVDFDKEGVSEGRASLGDWYGRAVWALAYTVAHGRPTLRSRARQLLLRLWSRLGEVAYIRSTAYALLGLCLLGETSDGEFANLSTLRDQMAERILASYRANADDVWYWFEPEITYNNARLCEALMAYARVTGNKEAGRTGVTALNFLIGQTYDVLDNCFRFIGSKGWLPRGGKKAAYDEQPVEAGVTAEALAEAYRLTGDYYYFQMAEKAMAWYHGDNANRRPLFNSVRQSVYDGLTADGVNLNQGAESILSYHLGYFAVVSAIAKQEGLSRGEVYTIERPRATARVAAQRRVGVQRRS